MIGRLWLKILMLATVLLFVVSNQGALAADLTEAKVTHQSSREWHVPSGWETRLTQHFRIHSAPEDRKHAEYLAEEIDGWMEASAERVGVTVSGKIDVLLAPDGQAFAALQPGNAPAWAVGTAYSSLGLITVKSPRAMRGALTDYSLHQTTVHEIGHIVLDWALKGQPVPRWLHEGLAKYIAGETTWESRLRLSQAVLTGSLISMDELSRDFPRGSTRASLAYAQSLEFLSYLMSEFGNEVVPKMVTELSKGNDFETAIVSVTGLSATQLEAEWHDHMRFNFAWLPALTSGGGLWVFASFLMMVGWLRKRAQSKVKRARWEVEEALVYGSGTWIHSPEVPETDPKPWPSHLRVIEGGAPVADEDDDHEDTWKYPPSYDEDDDRPPPGGWLH